jgi:hypothetical protein
MATDNLNKPDQEPSEAQKLEADRQANINKAERRAYEESERALDLQIKHNSFTYGGRVKSDSSDV